jgi:hypothetical protein
MNSLVLVTDTQEIHREDAAIVPLTAVAAVVEVDRDAAADEVAEEEVPLAAVVEVDKDVVVQLPKTCK